MRGWDLLAKLGSLNERFNGIISRPKKIVGFLSHSLISIANHIFQIHFPQKTIGLKEFCFSVFTKKKKKIFLLLLNFFLGAYIFIFFCFFVFPHFRVRFGDLNFLFRSGFGFVQICVIEERGGGGEEEDRVLR